MLNVTSIPAAHVPVVDPATGRVSREWYRYFYNNFVLLGDGNNPVSVEDAQKTPTPPDTTAFLTALSSAVQSTPQPDLGTMAAVQQDNVRFLTFSNVPSPPVVGTPGTVWWDATGTLNITMGNGNITQQVGEEFFIYGKASSAISDTNLQLVYKTGVVGASGVITFAPTIAGITDADQILGIATESLAKNDFGRITAKGVVHGINTTGSVYGETWADNDEIWYNPVTGGLTKTKPSAPNLKLFIGTIINAGPGGSGSFFVNIGPSSVLGGTDSNVQFGALASGNLLVYDAIAGYWKNAFLTAGSGITITNGPGSVTVATSGTIATSTPVTITSNYSVGATDAWVINNKSGSSCTLTLPSAATNSGRVITVQNWQAQTVVSASANVVPLGGGAAATGILSADVGDWATLVSDGTNWIVTQAAVNNALLLE